MGSFKLILKISEPGYQRISRQNIKIAEDQGKINR